MPYLISDFSKICGVSAFNIRYYEKKGLAGGERSESGYRKYKIEDAYRFNTFNALLSQGFSVAEAVERLEAHSAPDYVAALERNDRKTEEQIWLLQQRLRWNGYMRHVYSDPEAELTALHEITLPELCFLPCTEGLDLTPSLMLDRTIEAWVELLPASFYAAHQTESRFSLGLAMERALAQRRGLENGKTLAIPGGQYYALLMRGEDGEELDADARITRLLAQGDRLPEERVLVYTMVNIEGYGENMYYCLIKKT